jgi:hypothetical protein
MAPLKDDDCTESKLPAMPTAGSLTRMSSIASAASATILLSLDWFRSTDSATAMVLDEAAQNGGDDDVFDMAVIGLGGTISHCDGTTSGRNTLLNTAHSGALPNESKFPAEPTESLSRNSSVSTVPFLQAFDWVWDTEPEVMPGSSLPSPGSSPQQASLLVGSHEGKKLNMNAMPAKDDTSNDFIKLLAKPTEGPSRGSSSHMTEWLRSTSLVLFRTMDSVAVILKEEAKKSGIVLDDENLFASNKVITNTQNSYGTSNSAIVKLHASNYTTLNLTLDIPSKIECDELLPAATGGANISRPNEEPQTDLYEDFMQEMNAACAPVVTNSVTPTGTPLSNKKIVCRKRKQPDSDTNVVQEPTEKDVLCGRGGDTIRHNVHFIDMCEAVADDYSATRQRGMDGKHGIAMGIVLAIQANQGRFIKQSTSGCDGSDGAQHWQVLPLQGALDKTAHCIRDIINKRRKNEQQQQQTA